MCHYLDQCNIDLDGKVILSYKLQQPVNSNDLLYHAHFFFQLE
jgi:hypothetical protein